MNERRKKTMIFYAFALLAVVGFSYAGTYVYHNAKGERVRYLNNPSANPGGVVAIGMKPTASNAVAETSLEAAALVGISLTTTTNVEREAVLD